MIDLFSTGARLSLHHLTALDAPMVDLIGIAGELGCDHVCLFTHVPEAIAGHYPCVGENDVATISSALAQAGVTLCNIEVFPLDANPDWTGFERSLAIGQALGATRATVHIHGIDDAAGAAALSRFCDLAAGYGIAAGLEFNGFSAVRTLPQAAAIVRAADRTNVSIVCDMLHLVRNGGGVADVAAERDLVGYVQLCDGPLEQPQDVRWHEAIRERGVPGTGAFPLADVLATLRSDTVIDVEVPQTAARKAGETPLERCRRAVEATRTLVINHMKGGAAE